MIEIRSGGRQNGKTAAMWDEMLRVWREHEERAEEERLIVICHSDDHERVKAQLDEAQRRIFAPRRVTLLASPYAIKGTLIAFEVRHLPEWARADLVVHREDT